jgi:hypothetical protein
MIPLANTKGVRTDSPIYDEQPLLAYDGRSHT